MPSNSAPRLSVLLETSCLADGRAQAGIGRYARQLRRSLVTIPGLDISSLEVRPPVSESRPGRFYQAQLPALLASRRHKPHILHGVGGEPVAGFPPSRQVVTLFDMELWRGDRPPAARGMALRAHAAVQARLLRNCAAFIAISDASAREAVATLDIDPDRVHVIPMGVGAVFTATPAPYDEEALARAGLRTDGYLLWAGSLRHHDPRKALDTLLDAIARVDDARPLALVGAAGDEAERVSAEARLRGIEVVLCGRVEDSDLAALYRHASVTVISSRHEGFGMPALEAMASGCPVVSTDGGNLGELVSGAGIAVAVDDAQALAEGIREVLSRPRRRDELRRAGLARAADYTWQACAEATAAVYRLAAASA